MSSLGDDLDLSSIGVSAVDVATIQQNVIHQVKQSKKDALNKELQSTNSSIQRGKAEIKKIGRILRHFKQHKLKASSKEIECHLAKQKQIAKELQSQMQSKAQLLDKIQRIQHSIDQDNPPNDSTTHDPTTDSITNLSPPPKRGKKRTHHEMECKTEANATHNTTEQWQCTRCTLLNDKQHRRCSVCNTLRPRNTNSHPPHKRAKTDTTALYQPFTHSCDDADDEAFESRLKSFYACKAIINNKSDPLAENDRFYNDSLGFIDITTKTKYESKPQCQSNDNCILPLWLYNALYKFQRKGVEWLWQLYNKQVGGILGDDMGLGKTIQTIAFLHSLRVSGRGGAVLIVCPASVLVQWMRECHRWCPEIRVLLFHDSGRHKATHREIMKTLHDSCLCEDDDGEYVDCCGAVLITTYTSLCLNEALLLPIKWALCVLDEGHKIRNPNANITMTCKQLKCRHRVILSGSPLQNTLSDLWSLFDFIFPGRLATLPVFEEEFVIPIKCGGYCHASALQIEEGIATANALKDIIDPHILRRTKDDSAHGLFIPHKTEQVLFCKLSDEQLTQYEKVLHSHQIESRSYRQKKGSGFTFRVISALRKICNHSDLLVDEAMDYGNTERSGKLQVMKVILSQWNASGHKSLIFCQTKQFLDIVEAFVKRNSFSYRRLDGSTPVRNRQNMISEYNENDAIFLFLLTTRAGGLGINLCGANRVIVCDPDWNPSTDAQARERCYRIGQKRDVTIYRLITRGTIEEKVYHRQIYKQFLTDKVLKDPNNERMFSEKDLKDLFSLKVDDDDTGKLVSEWTRNKTSINGGDECNKEDETEILSALFSTNGIASAFRHNHIETLPKMERRKLEKRAKKMAQRALKALDKSRNEINNHFNITQPTWTGREGFNCSAIDEKRKRFGNHRDLIHILRGDAPLSSASLLAQIKGRRQVKPSTDLKNKKYELLVQDLYDFVKNAQDHGGVASDVIIRHFDHRLSNEQEQYILKIVLQKMCRLVAQDSSRAKAWVLKDKYMSLSL